MLRGLKGRRAMPRICVTSRARSSAETSALPISPVGPVTATVRSFSGAREAIATRVLPHRARAVFARAKARLLEPLARLAHERHGFGKHARDKRADLVGLRLGV